MLGSSYKGFCLKRDFQICFEFIWCSQKFSTDFNKLWIKPLMLCSLPSNVRWTRGVYIKKPPSKSRHAFPKQICRKSQRNNNINVDNITKKIKKKAEEIFVILIYLIKKHNKLFPGTNSLICPTILADIFLALFVAWVIHVVAFIEQINRKNGSTHHAYRQCGPAVELVSETESLHWEAVSWLDSDRHVQ